MAELFEARKPKDASVIAPVDGYVKFGRETKGKRQIFIVPRGNEAFLNAPVEPDEPKKKGKKAAALAIPQGDGPPVVEFLVPKSKHMIVREGDFVNAGEPLMDGPVNPHDILRVKGEKDLAAWLLNEIQQVYRLQGVAINDKHIETIVRQMLRRVRVTTVGETDFLVDEQVEKWRFEQENLKAARKVLRSFVEEGKVKNAGVADADSSRCRCPAREHAPASERSTRRSVSQVRSRRTDCARDSRTCVWPYRTPSPWPSIPCCSVVTKASLSTDSFISPASSFQETTKVLTEAASISGQRRRSPRTQGERHHGQAHPRGYGPPGVHKRLEVTSSKTKTESAGAEPPRREAPVRRDHDVAMSAQLTRSHLHSSSPLRLAAGNYLYRSRFHAQHQLLR